MRETNTRIEKFLENGLPFLLFVALTLICFWEYIFTDNVPMSRDDALNYQVGRKFIVDCMRAGYLPMWCPFVAMGYPLPAEGQVGLSQPFTILFFIFPFFRAYAISIIICYPLFAFFTYRLGRTWELGREGAILTAIAVTFAGPYFLWQEGYPIIATLLWLPLLIICLVKASRGDQRKLYMALGSLLYALMIFSGNFQFVFGATIFTFFFLWFVGDSRAAFPLRRVLQCFAPVIILGGILGAVQLIPQYELAMLSERAGGVFDPAEGNLNWNELASLGAPIFYYPFKGDWAGGAIYGYIGFLGTALAICGITVSRGKVLILLLIGIIVALAFGGFTSLGLFRCSNRMLFFLTFLLSLYAGHAFGTLLKGERSRLSHGKCVAITGGVVIFLALLAGSYFNVHDLNGFIRLLIPQVIVIALTILFLGRRRQHWPYVTALAAFVMLTGSVCIHGIANYSVALDYETVNAEPEVVKFLKSRAGDGRVWVSLIERKPNTLLYQLSADGPRVALYGIATPAHETPLHITGCSLFRNKMVKSFATFAHETNDEGINSPRPDILAAVKYIVVLPEVADNLDYPEIYRDTDSYPPFSVLEVPDYKGMAFFLFPRTVNFNSQEKRKPQIDGFVPEQDGRTHSLLLNGPAREIRTEPAASYARTIEPFRNPNRVKIEYSAPAGSFLFISQMHYPGWRACINGKPAHLYRAYGLFCGVVVDDEEGVVDLIYEPSSWMTGAVISIAGFCLWLWLLIPHFFKIYRIKNKCDILGR